jgi:hypothetical protein
MSGSYTFSNTFFATTGYSIPTGTGLWLNNANVTVTGQAGTVTLVGQIRVSNGTYNVGTGSGNSLTYSTGSSFIMEGGAMNVAGRFSRDGTNGSTITYDQSGGTLTVVTSASTSTTRAGFDIGATGSSFTMSGGAIVLQQGTSNATEYNVIASTNSVTGGTIQLGNASTTTAQTFVINSTAPIYDLTLNATNSPTGQLNTALTIVNNLLISGGTFDANGQNISIGGNWTRNGGTVTTGTQTVTFNNTSSDQNINGSATSQTFNSITVTKSSTKLT